MLVIADGDKPIGLAGIMGGENSEIVADTTTVVFESANFNGTSIRQTALALGLRTEASGKFEKNLDPMLTIPAVQRACELVEQLACGDVLDGTIDIINHVPQPKQLELEPDRINQLLGTQIPEADMVEYLRRLEIPVEGRTISVPSWRPDLNLTADIAEKWAGCMATTKFLPPPSGAPPPRVDIPPTCSWKTKRGASAGPWGTVK